MKNISDKALNRLIVEMLIAIDRNRMIKRLRRLGVKF
jgi:hypothetical protein